MSQFPFLKDEVLQKGETFDQYVVIEEISRGGMGIIYKCRSSHRVVAVKFLLKQASDHISNKRLLREASVLAELQHPNIVSVYSAGVYKNQLYIVMEYIEGQPLETFPIASLTINERVLLIKKVALALHYAHTNGIIHRDVKPSNILIEKNNNPKLVDFGLAKSLKIDSEKLTVSGTSVGTPRYMSPEQINGKRINAQSDIYSLGCILFEIIYQQKLVLGDTPLEIFYNMQLRNKRLAETKDFRGINSICRKATREQNHRYKTTLQFANDLEKYLQRKYTSFYFLKKIFIACASVMLLIFVITWHNTPSKTVTILQPQELSTQIEKLLQHREYLEAQHVFSKLSQERAQQLAYLHAQILIGLKEYSLFNEMYRDQQFKEISCRIAIAEMNCHLRKFEEAQFILNTVPPIKGLYTKNATYSDIRFYLEGQIFFYRREYDQAHKAFANIENPQMFFQSYPQYFFYLGVLNHQQQQYQQAFRYLQQAYMQKPSTEILHAMADSVIALIAHKPASSFLKSTSQVLLRTLRQQVEREPMSARLHAYLAQIYYARGNTKQAYKHALNAIELGEYNVRIFEIPVEIAKNHFLQYQGYMVIFRDLFLFHERETRPQIFSQQVQLLREKYARDYELYHNNVQKYDENKFIDLMKRAPENIREVMVRSLPADKNTFERIVSVFPHQQKMRDFLLQKRMRLYRYYLAYVYETDNTYMLTKIEQNFSDILQFILCNPKEYIVMRYLALKTLLRLTGYTNIKSYHAQITQDQHGKFIYDLTMFRYGLRDITQQQVNEYWQWYDTQHDFFAKAYMIDTMIERRSTYLLPFTPKQPVTREDVLLASYTFITSPTPSDALREYLFTAIDSDISIRLKQYAYYALLQHSNIENPQDSRTFFTGISHAFLSKQLLKNIVIQQEILSRGKRLIVLKNTPDKGIFARRKFTEKLHSILHDQQDFELTNLAGKLWSSLNNVDSEQIQKFINNKDVSIVVKLMTYFYFIESHPEVLFAYFLRNLSQTSSFRKQNEFLLLSHFLKNAKVHNLDKLFLSLKDEDLKVLLFRVLHAAVSLRSLFPLVESETADIRHKLLASYVVNPLHEGIADYSLQFFCSNIHRYPIIGSMLQHMCNNIDRLKVAELQARKKFIRQVAASISKNLYGASAKKHQTFLVSHALYARATIEELVSKWKNRKKKQKSAVAEGLYRRIKAAFFQDSRAKKLREILSQNRVSRSFPFKGIRIQENRYNSYIQFLEQQCQTPEEAQYILQILTAAITLSPNEVYFYERGILYTQIGEWQKALDDITKALTYSPHNVYFLIAKITAQLQLPQHNHDQLITQLDSLYKETTSRLILKRIAALYKKHGKMTKYRTILERLYIEDSLDIEVIANILNSYTQENSQTTTWKKALKIAMEKIQRKKLPIDMKEE